MHLHGPYNEARWLPWCLPVICAWLLGGCGGNSQLTLKPYQTSGEARLLSSANDSEPPAPEFGAFAVEGSGEGSFSTDTDAGSVAHVFSMGRKDNVLYAYLHKMGFSWFYSIDVTTPTAPSLQESLLPSEEIPDNIIVDGDRLYGIGTGHSGKDNFQIFDISVTPMTKLGGLVLGPADFPAVQRGSVSGNRAALFEYSSGMASGTWRLFDTADPTNIGAPISPAALDGCSQDSFVDGTRFFCFGSDDGPVVIFDVSDPTSVTEVTSIGTAVQAMTAMGERAYAVTSESRTSATFDLYDLSTTPPTLLDSATVTLSGEWGAGGKVVRVEPGLLVWLDAADQWVDNHNFKGSVVVELVDQSSLGRVGCFRHYNPFDTSAYPYGNVGPSATGVSLQGDDLILGTSGGGLQVYPVEQVLSSSCA